jgi:hypothetical protein
VINTSGCAAHDRSTVRTAFKAMLLQRWRQRQVAKVTARALAEKARLSEELQRGRIGGGERQATVFLHVRSFSATKDWLREERPLPRTCTTWSAKPATATVSC